MVSLLGAVPAFGDDVLHIGAAVYDRPTLVTIGVKLGATGDDNGNASVDVQYRVAGSGPWKDGLPLFRVHPEVVTGWTTPPGFGASIFELRPSTAYEIQLIVSDPDGIVDGSGLNLGVSTIVPMGTMTTRPVPGDPTTPRVRHVSNRLSLIATLRSLQPGDVVVIAAGTYPGSYTVNASGTPENPIVIRGANTFTSGYVDHTLLEGRNCRNCSVLEVYGSHVHIEQLTVQNALRGLQFSGTSTGNVVRRVHIRDTTLGIGSQPDQTDFYIADNILQGRLAWPLTYGSDNGRHADDDGINVHGSGHVVAHNQISGFGDAMKIGQIGARAVDFYGNDVLWTYDNGLELDKSEGNTRGFRNRFTNTFATLSAQPIYGGPAYLIRNIVVNVANEQLKFHSLGTTEEPSGILVYHNTFVSPQLALNLQTSATTHYFTIANNLFVGPSPLPDRLVDWTGGIDHGTFDHNGYYPDGPFSFKIGGAYTTYPDLAALQSATGMELNGLILAAIGPNGSVFASGLKPPSSYTVFVTPQDATPASGSLAVDGTWLLLPNVNDRFGGAAPDLGAVEVGCPQPMYGPRPAGVDESNEVTGCS